MTKDYERIIVGLACIKDRTFENPFTDSERDEMIKAFMPQVETFSYPISISFFITGRERIKENIPEYADFCSGDIFNTRLARIGGYKTRFIETKPVHSSEVRRKLVTGGWKKYVPRKVIPIIEKYLTHEVIDILSIEPEDNDFLHKIPWINKYI